LADVIADAPCFSDYRQLDALFPESTFIYLNRDLDLWIPSIQRLLTKMQPQLGPSGYLHPVLKRSINSTFSMASYEPLQTEQLIDTYRAHQMAVLDYFENRSDFLSIDISLKGSLKIVLDFLGLPSHGMEEFLHVNKGKEVDAWKNTKHPNKIDALSAGIEHRAFFDYT
jgi:hypothetical protein